jgi:hypothetical protein
MPHLPPAHHEANKRDSPNETKVKEKQNKTIPDLNSNLAKSITHHNQTKELTTWFLSCDPMQSMLTQTKMPHELPFGSSVSVLLHVLTCKIHKLNLLGTCKTYIECIEEASSGGLTT